ncbi:MAG TPA: hypothetical protein VFW28_04175 [Micropepsaceae bacterium]|nr:hypothetical protein [Micropepsaceae bacterium]
MTNGNLDSLLDKLREMFAQEYQRGQHDALRRVVDAMRTPGGRGGRRAGRRSAAKGGRIRARRGAARAFIERVLKEKGGATVPQIMTAATSADEKAVSISAIRFELYRGKKDRRYKNTSGKWSLPAGRK